ncbi:MAG TPA: YCF48-related protein [Candidatus Acidoferrum sp.]|nr:YCF48-related protein [Candidatus Acidoferrum sp.]
MKTVLYLLFFAAVLASAAGAQVFEIVPYPMTDNITGIQFLNTNTGFAVTSEGHFARTVNGAKSWVVDNIPPGVPLEDLSFINRDTGLLCGRGGTIYRTIDAGATWENRTLKDTMPWILSIRLLEHQVALAVGMTREASKPLTGVVWRSTDGGMHWDAQPSMGLGYGELFVEPGKRVCFQSFGKLNCSTDEGRVWTSEKTVEGKPGRATAFFGKTGVIVGNNGMCAYSNDGGKTWATVTADDNVHFTSVVLASEKLGYMAGTGGAMFRTDDGGKSWQKVMLPASFDVHAMCLIGRTLYAAGSGGHMVRATVGAPTSTTPTKTTPTKNTGAQKKTRP